MRSYESLYQPSASRVDKDITLQADVQEDEEHSCLLAGMIVAYAVQAIGDAFKQ